MSRNCLKQDRGNAQKIGQHSQQVSHDGHDDYEELPDASCGR